MWNVNLYLDVAETLNVLYTPVRWEQKSLRVAVYSPDNADTSAVSSKKN